jgi:hypothetical protein
MMELGWLGIKLIRKMKSKSRMMMTVSVLINQRMIKVTMTVNLKVIMKTRMDPAVAVRTRNSAKKVSHQMSWTKGLKWRTEKGIESKCKGRDRKKKKRP